MAKKIIIGIVGKHTKIIKKRTNTYIRYEIKQAIFDNGGIAIGILSPNEELMFYRNDWKIFENDLIKQNILDQIDLCDGIILQGGITNEAFEAFIAKYCYEKDIPCLGICAGQNCIVNALNGTVKTIDNPEKHFRPDDDYVHEITIDKNSKFFDIIKKEKIMVNSRHKNTIDNIANLNKAALCVDSYIDVVEAKNKKFYIGLRFHPESLYKIDNNMNKIFRFFLEQCKK